MPALESPLPQFFELDGSPLDAGFIYVGLVDQDPEENPIPLYWDAAMTVPAPQPLRTLNGMVARDGTPAFVYAETDHSMMVLSKRGVQVLYAGSSQLFSLIQSIADMVMDTMPVSPYIMTLLDDADAPAARGTLEAAKSGTNSDITSLTGLTTPLSPAQGGTGQNSLVAAQAALPIGQTRINVASAATVNLTTAAPGNDQINITGTTTITGFTIPAGRMVFVRFDSALTLTSNASIVTQRGVNINTRAGDTCLLRATAANTVEVMFYSRALGSRTWQNMSGTRAVNTDQNNTSGQEIIVSVIFTATTGQLGAIRASGLDVSRMQGGDAGGTVCQVTAPIGPGEIYSFRDLAGTTTGHIWFEMR